MLGAADPVARAGTLVAIFVGLVALYLHVKQHLRDTERLAAEKRQRDSASLTWEVMRGSAAGARARLDVTNSGADAQNLRVTLSQNQHEAIGLNPGDVRRGMTATCGDAYSIRLDATSIDWHLDAQWTDATGPRKEHWHLTHFTSWRTSRR